MLRRLVLIVSILAIFGVGVLAGYALFHSSVIEKSADNQPITVAVESGSVGQSLKFNAEIATDKRLVATNILSGVITAVSADKQFNAGDMLYEVAGHCVFAAPGDTPFYRDLRLGMRGKDVRQLNAMLNALGYPGAVDDTFGSITQSNVKRWQRQTGQEQTGEIILGQLIAIPTLPSEVVFDREVAKTGRLLNGGEEIVFVSVESPRIYLVLGESQKGSLRKGNVVTLSQGENEWSGFIGDTTEVTETNSFEVEIVSEKGGAVCSDNCPDPEADSSLVASVEIVPTVSGSVVPRSAIMADASGNSYVVNDAGERLDIKVIGVSGGTAVVEGVEPGKSVRVFGDKE